MTKPAAYVAVANEYGRRIRNGTYPPGMQLLSHAEIGKEFGVSDIVVRGALKVLQAQGLVHTIRRRGTFVTDNPGRKRVSPERQMEAAEETVKHEADRSTEISREVEQVELSQEDAHEMGFLSGGSFRYTVTRISEGDQAISISDTYQPQDVSDVSAARQLEETLCFKPPSTKHATWLGLAAGGLAIMVRQRFITDTERVIMVSDVSYPQGRYDAFVFRMSMNQD